MIRVFYPVPEERPEKLGIRGERFHYLARVLRLGAGDSLQVFDGKGRTFAAQVRSIGTDELELELAPARIAAQAPTIVLIQGLPKGEKLDWILQKATELGVASIAPVAMQHCVAKLRPSQVEHRHQRWQKIAEEAARQCGRADVPRILPYQPLSESIRHLSPGTRLFVLDEREPSVRLGQGLVSLGDADAPLALIVGPEGGVHPSELRELLESGGRSVSLGRRILRTETASLAALAVVLHVTGDLG